MNQNKTSGVEKKKGECCEECKETTVELCRGTCPCHSDPLTSLLQSASKEFKERFIKQGYFGDKPIPPALVIPFLLSKLTEAFNKGKEIK